MSQHQNTEIDYAALIVDYPWIIERDQSCILSPDSDGLLCGLFMSHYLGWKIKGFYDGKVMAVEKDTRPQECVFLDMEIFRQHIRSVGQHMVMYDKAALPANWSNFSNCIAANNLKNFDFKNDFKIKYPLGTIHLLISILGHTRTIPVNKGAVSILLYTDGTFKNQFNYPENCLAWLDFMGAQNEHNPLQKIFLDKHYSTYELMVELRELFSEISVIGGGKRGGDKIKISDSQGNIVNIDERTNNIKEETRVSAIAFLEMLARRTGWNFTPHHWSWGPYQTTRFKKASAKPGKARYNAVLEKNPLSLAIISRKSIEYTLDEHGVL